MNFKYIFIFFLLIITSSYSQSKEFVLNWENNKDISISGDKKVYIHGFQTENFNYNIDKKSLVFSSNIKNIYSGASIISVSYEDMSNNQLLGYDKSLIKNKIELSLKRTNSRGKLGAYLTFNPIIKNSGVYKKVTSIQLKFDYSNRSSSSSSSLFTITDSEMSNGLWYKFYIEKSGVHKLDRSFFESLGVDVTNVNPKNIRLFGNGGKSIPLLNSEVSEFDVKENAVKFIGQQDDVFNQEDYMLFYASGSLGWNVDNQSHINPYIDKTYYYINISSLLGKRIQNMVEPTGVITNVYSKYNEVQFFEIDKNNIAKLGRRWFGDGFDVNSNQIFSFYFPNIDVSQPAKLKVRVAASSSSFSSMQLKSNGVLIDDFTFPPISSTSLGTEDFYDDFINVNNSTVNISLDYNNNSNPSANAYLDFISLEVSSFLVSRGFQFVFKNNDASNQVGIGEYIISSASSISEVWDISDVFNVSSKINLTGNTFSFKSSLGEVKEYVSVVNSDYYTPFKDESAILNNSNLKGSIFNSSSGGRQDIDYLIITPQRLISQANRLANINTENYGLRTKVVSLESIYSEFNTSNPDIGAVRNFVRYVYQNGVTDKLKYLCLFGDASYDMKDRIQSNTNVVPSYHSLQSFSLVSGFISDDFFGMMDENEGSMNGADRLDIAVGRIIVDDLQQATEMVTKIEQYHLQESYGSWRNRMTILSDDVDKDWEFSLENELNDLADQIVSEKPFINMVKLHSDSFLQESSAGGDSYPKAKESLLDNIQLGSLVVNYFGHGGEEGLASERLFLRNDAQNLNNKFKYNLFVTITCDFTRFDNPSRQTAGELLYWNKKGGAISLVATTREIFMSLGIFINRELSRHLFDYEDTGYVSVAEALRITKNNTSNNLKRIIFSIGDPALKLSIPEPNISLTHINDIPIENIEVPALESLGRVSFSGSILDASGQLISNYNGKLSTTIYDKNQNKSTLGNDGTVNSSGLIILDYEDLGEIIFRGQSSVVNGKFDFDFVVPRDISIPLGDGRVSFYAKRDGVLENQTGVNTSIVVGGINENAVADNLPPTIEAFMNDESFVSGGITGQSPFLLINLEDENGINTASGIGHDITAIIDGDEANPQILNDYYETELDDFTKGKVKYQYRDLEPGLHTLLVKAWDSYNNSISTEIQFIVVNENDELVINRVLNYPNPFVSYTEFWFNHNSSSELEVMVQVYTVTGKLIKTLRGNSLSNNNSSDSSLFRGLPWDGRDDFGDKIGKGVYVYKLTVKSINTNKKAVKFEKLVIL
jgi:hypothetical protein